MNPRSLLLAAATLSLVFAQGALAAVIVPGSTYTVTATNFPNGSGTVIVTEGTSTNVEGLTLTDTIVPEGPNSAWIEWNFVNPTGGPLAGNLGATWQINIDGLQFTGPATFNNAFLYWTANGTAFSPINTFGGITYEGNSNPFNPALGPVYGGNPFSAVGPENPWNIDPLVFVSPYSFINAGGNNDMTANDYHDALLFTLVSPVTTPEPASLALLGTGLVGLAFARRRRRD